MPSLPDRKRTFRDLRRALRGRDADARPPGTGGGLSRGRKDKAFREEFPFYLREYAGRETPLYVAQSLTEKLGGAKIYLKREDLNHTGSHKINNTLGQALLARRMGKKRVIAETGRRPARRGHGHGGGALRHGVPDLHGRGGHPAAGPQRLPDEDPRRRGRPRRRRDGHPQGRHERGDARLGDRRPRHLLRHRHRGGPPPLPGDGPGFPERHRPGDEAADPEAGGAAARLPHRLRGRREQRHGALLPLPQRRQVWS